MKLRKTINNNACKYTGLVWEDSFKIIVQKYNVNDLSLGIPTMITFKFDTISEYEEWIKTQNWIKKINKVSNFKNIREL